MRVVVCCFFCLKFVDCCVEVRCLVVAHWLLVVGVVLVIVGVARFGLFRVLSLVCNLRLCPWLLYVVFVIVFFFELNCMFVVCYCLRLVDCCVACCVWCLFFCVFDGIFLVWCVL